MAFILSEKKGIELSLNYSVIFEKMTTFQTGQFLRESKSIALQKSSNFSKIFFILRIVLLAFIWSEKRGIELSFQIRVLFLKKSHFFRRDNF